MSDNTKDMRWRNLRRAMMGSTALVAAVGFQGAMAQEAEDDEAEATNDVIVVQGVRGALLNARNTKRESDTFVDSITASDVSQLPDLSVAEALSRIPGVVTQRFELGGSDGDFPSPEGSGNIVRGLPYTRSEFNGRDAFSATGGRALEWASIPPELIGAVDVFKNQTADMIEGGIAGTVNLRTLEPFDRSGRFAVLAAETIYTDLAEEWSPGFSAIVGDRWDTGGGEFGIVASFSTSELNSAVDGFQYGPLLAIPNPDGNGTIALPGGWQMRQAEIGRERDSYYLAGQWRSPSGDIEFTAKAVRVENTINTTEHTIEFFTDAESWAAWSVLGGPETRSIIPFQSQGISRCNGNGEAANGGIGICEQLFAVDAGLMESGVVSNNLRDWLGETGNLQTPLQSLAINQVEESMTQDFSANLKWQATDRLFIELDGHITEAEATLERLWAGGNHFADYRFDFSDSENPEVELFMSDAVQLASWGTTRGPNPGTLGDLADPRFGYLLYSADEYQDNEGDAFAVRADALYEFDGDGWFDSVKFGARFAEREQNNRSAGLNWGGIAPPWAGGYLPYANMDNSSFYETFDFSNFQRGGVISGFTSIVFPSQANMSNIDAYVQSLANEPLLGSFINADGNLQVGDWVPLRQNGVIDYAGRGIDGNVVEETTNLYAMVNFGQEFEGNQAITGNFGLRYIRTENSGTGVLGFAEFAPDDPNDNTEPRDFLPELANLLDTPNAPNTLNSSYEYILPSFNMKLDLNEDMLIRVGASQSITRPDISTINSTRTSVADLGFVTDPNSNPPAVVDIVPNRLNQFGGNPFLEPIEATNFDISYEWYFGDDGLFSAAVFYKQLDNVIIYGTETQDVLNLDGYQIPVVYNGNINLNDGTVNGIEFSYQNFFTEWPGLLGNLGVQANATFIESDADALPSVADQDGDGVEGFLTVYRWGIEELLGLSDQSYNLIGIYQDDRFEARLAYNWRSAYFSSYRDFVTGNPIIQDDIGFLDGSIRWTVTDNFELSLQAANLLDQKSTASQQVDQAGQTYARSVFVNDRRFEFGIRYDF